ncbi:membrane hypothetical protein [Candidatus Nitrosotenuis uzonensis]|uniref:CAAX prenyl protease 2/Lysostaphin resistance protein A-like domain-containing protein n=2 Tax=Candidatus Nitrosotenuis uzonensis TaxID=1407055 RepID=V6ATW5_9ARCH|nr:membrane hypothetical protein [Candidatus Nitrosotenuis uzonensis]
MNPRSWTKKFQKNSISYLIQMAAFYHALSITIMYASSFGISHVISDYEAPSFPISVVMTVTSGPIEEILFFGLAYYVAGTPQAILFTGAIWSVAHIFSTHVFQINTLGYASFLFAIPHMFFSIRTWLSGKGWFAILFHSVWNTAFLLSYCYLGIKECSVVGTVNYLTVDFLAIGLAASLISIIWTLHNKSKISKTVYTKILIFSITAFLLFEVLINFIYIKMLL